MKGERAFMMCLTSLTNLHVTYLSWGMHNSTTFAWSCPYCLDGKFGWEGGQRTWHVLYVTMSILVRRVAMVECVSFLFDQL